MKFEIPVYKSHYTRTPDHAHHKHGVMHLALRDRFPYFNKQYGWCDHDDYKITSGVFDVAPKTKWDDDTKQFLRSKTRSSDPQDFSFEIEINHPFYLCEIWLREGAHVRFFKPYVKQACRVFGRIFS